MIRLDEYYSIINKRIPVQLNSLFQQSILIPEVSAGLTKKARISGKCNGWFLTFLILSRVILMNLLLAAVVTISLSMTGNLYSMSVMST